MLIYKNEDDLCIRFKKNIMLYNYNKPRHEISNNLTF